MNLQVVGDQQIDLQGDEKPLQLFQQRYSIKQSQIEVNKERWH